MYADSTLLAAYSVVVETVDVDNLTRIVVLNATSSDGIGPLAFEEVSVPELYTMISRIL